MRDYVSVIRELCFSRFTYQKVLVGMTEMVIINSEKYACEVCVRDHRVSCCNQSDMVLIPRRPMYAYVLSKKL